MQGKTRKKAVEGNGQRIPLEHATPPKTALESKKNLLFQGGIFRFHVSFRGCMCFDDVTSEVFHVQGFYREPGDNP